MNLVATGVRRPRARLGAALPTAIVVTGLLAGTVLGTWLSEVSLSGSPELWIAYHQAEEFVADGRHNFRTAGTPQRLGPMLKLDWEMCVVATGEVVGRGTEVLTIGADRRIQSDYQFIDP